MIIYYLSILKTITNNYIEFLEKIQVIIFSNDVLLLIE